MTYTPQLDTPPDPAWIQAVKRMYQESPVLCIVGMTCAGLALVGFLSISAWVIAKSYETGRWHGRSGSGTWGTATQQPSPPHEPKKSAN
jgi:hypothetical protein